MYSSNDLVVEIFKNIHDLILIRGNPEDKWKPQAYEKAIESINEFEQNIFESVEKIYGVGDGLQKKIQEIKETGTCKYYEDLKTEVPISLLEILKINGIGPVTVRKLWKEANIYAIEDFEKAFNENKIRLTKAQIEGWKAYKANQGQRMPYEEAVKLGTPILEYVQKIYISEFGGSMRRKKSTIKDIDILICSDNPNEVSEYIKQYPGCSGFQGQKQMFHCFITNRRVDILIIPQKEWGAALNYFTGSKEHNVLLRYYASCKGYKINEKGYWVKDGERLGGESEEALYDLLGLNWIPPEKREGNTELLKQTKEKK